MNYDNCENKFSLFVFIVVATISVAMAAQSLCSLEYVVVITYSKQHEPAVLSKLGTFGTGRTNQSRILSKLGSTRVRWNEKNKRVNPINSQRENPILYGRPFTFLPDLVLVAGSLSPQEGDCVLRRVLCITRMSDNQWLSTRHTFTGLSTHPRDTFEKVCVVYVTICSGIFHIPVSNRGLRVWKLCMIPDPLAVGNRKETAQLLYNHYIYITISYIKIFYITLYIAFYFSDHSTPM